MTDTLCPRCGFSVDIGEIKCSNCNFKYYKEITGRCSICGEPAETRWINDKELCDICAQSLILGVKLFPSIEIPKYLEPVDTLTYSLSFNPNPSDDFFDSDFDLKVNDVIDSYSNLFDTVTYKVQRLLVDKIRLTVADRGLSVVYGVKIDLIPLNNGSVIASITGTLCK
jgi:hypothetical protein